MSEPNLKAHLAADATVQSLIGGRIYFGKIPQKVPHGAATMDCCVYQLVGVERQPMHCRTDGTVGASYQIDIYSPIADNVEPIARAIRNRLIDYSGLMGDARVSKVLLDNEFSTPADPDPGLFRRTQLYTIWHIEGRA